MLDKEHYERFIMIFPEGLGQALKDAFRESVKYIQITKAEALVEEGKKSEKIYYIIKGSCVRYVIGPHGEERAIMFHTEDFLPVVGNVYIKSENAAVSYSIKANENTKAFEIDIATILKWGPTDPVYALNAARVSANLFSIQNQIQNHLIGLTSKDFLKWLADNYAFIFQRFSSKDIASFMNVTPTWLSLLKKKLQHQNIPQFL